MLCFMLLSVGRSISDRLDEVTKIFYIQTLSKFGFNRNSVYLGFG
jgi:hypothetical protein